MLPAEWTLQVTNARLAELRREAERDRLARLAGTHRRGGRLVHGLLQEIRARSRELLTVRSADVASHGSVLTTDMEQIDAACSTVKQ